ncbi:protein kinase domain-containing protein [Citrus sinensis]|uniref:Protein kinase domain-containing protein n=1 Tax=Citrus sinensis TaxID=2711 RepID=A0ACB8N1U6_CITSI|nr:protein kinase domain-containing protein [Citrus sinensis]
MSVTLAAIFGAAAGAVALMGIIFFLSWFCLYRNRSVSRTSETGSSEPSVQRNICIIAGRNVGIELSIREARRFQMEELSLATKNFSDKNLIGEGKFGEVYKGLLQDGMLVAIKKRPGAPTQEFIDEVRFLASIQHRNLVTLLGPSQVSRQKLEFKHRLSIALGAAKGLAHLHSLSPRVVHKDFKTANVLVDEDFIAKVADAGLRNFLGRTDVAGPSSQVTADEIFLASEVKEFRRFSEKSDVYSFGVFLLELVSGREASSSLSPDSSQDLVELVQNSRDFSNLLKILDERLWSTFTNEGMEEFIQLIVRCLDPSSERRPSMSDVVTELDRTLDKEMNLTTVMGEGTPTVTLGSHLFRATK